MHFFSIYVCVYIAVYICIDACRYIVYIFIVYIYIKTCMGLYLALQEVSVTADLA